MGYHAYDHLVNDVSQGILVLHHTEVQARLKSYKGTPTRLIPICPLPLWISKIEELAPFNTPKDYLSHDQIVVLIEYSRHNGNSSAIAALQNILSRSAPNLNTPAPPQKRPSRAALLTRATVEAARRMQAYCGARDAENHQESSTGSRRPRAWSNFFDSSK